MSISKTWAESRKKIYASLSMLTKVRTDDTIGIALRGNMVALLNSVIAVIFVLTMWTEEHRTFLTIWLPCSIFIFHFFCHANEKYPETIKNKYLTTRDLVFVVSLKSVTAIPWAVMTYPALGSGDLRSSLLILSIIAGASASASMRLYRVPLVAFGYMIIPAIGVGTTIITKQFDSLWPMLICAIAYCALLIMATLSSWRIAQENQNNLSRASKANQELQKANKEISYMANHDSLTGLLNRKAFIEILEQRLTQVKNNQFAVFLLDLDRFKNINDGIGHGAGDELLRIIAQRLQDAVTSSDIIARFGGDEFALIINIDNHAHSTTDIADKILSTLNTPATISNSTIHPNASFGITFYSDKSLSAEEFVSQADMALRHAKENGKGQYQIYNEGMATSQIHADKIEVILREALKDERVEVWYQPKIDLRTQTIAGAEALLRCFDPQGNIIPTEEVLDIAKDRGMIPEISRTVFNRVKTDILNWYAQKRPVIPVAINVHDYDLKTSDWLLSYLKDMLNSGISNTDIQLEVTEGCFVGRGADAATTALDMIDDLGIKLSLDDFGTGHAALSHLKRLPVSEIKIDQEFIKGINKDTRDEAIAFATVEIAKRMGIICVAEGIEKEEQLKRLENLLQDGITIIGQGHYWAPPMSFKDFTVFVDDWQKTKIPHKLSL